MLHRVFIIFALCFVFSGCSRNIKISGTVKFNDGEPVTLGTVMFDSPTHSFPGYLDEQGGYAVGESEDGAGVPPGDYTVWLAGTAIVKEAVPKKKQKTPKTAIDENGVEEQLEYPDTFEIPQVSQQYTLPDNSPLKFTVKSDGPKTFDIVVERYSNKKR